MTGSMYVLMQCWKWWPVSAWRATTEQPFLWLGRTPFPLNFQIFKLESYIWLYIAYLLYKLLEMSSSTSLVHGPQGFAAGDVETAHTGNFESIPDSLSYFCSLGEYQWWFCKGSWCCRAGKLKMKGAKQTGNVGKKTGASICAEWSQCDITQVMKIS